MYLALYGRPRRSSHLARLSQREDPDNPPDLVIAGVFRLSTASLRADLTRARQPTPLCSPETNL